MNEAQLAGLAVLFSAVYLIFVLVPFTEEKAWRPFPESRRTCFGPIWWYFITPWRVWAIDKDHCWHRPDTAKPPACCHCGKYHPDFKEKKDGPRKESTSVQGD